MNQINWGLLLLRLAAGTLLIFHAVPALVAGPDTWQLIGHTYRFLGLTQFYLQVGLVIVLVEIIGSGLLIMGIVARLAASLVLIIEILSLVIRLNSGHGISGCSNAILLASILACLLITGPGQFRLFLK